MIAKIRRRLSIVYTCIISLFLIAELFSGYAVYRYNGIKFIEDSLRDYLEEESWEAEQAAAGWQNTDIHKVTSNIMSFHNYTYWFSQGKLLHAEEPTENDVAQAIRNRLQEHPYIGEKIYEENVKANHHKWYFIVLKKELRLTGKPPVDVFVFANYTPLRKSTKTYAKMAVLAVIAMGVLAYLLSVVLLRRSMRYIENMYARQKQFVSDAAHELRTPLSILLSYTELLQYKPDSPETVKAIKDEILQMNDLISNLLTIARCDNQTIKLNFETFDLKVLAAETIAALKQLYPQNCTVNLEAPVSLPEITADKAMIRQLLLILLDNAVKYTPDNKIITVSLQNSATGVKISVKDNGIGIAQDDIEHIFERFWQADKSRSAKGLGLGLALAGILVQLHRGRIDVTSTVGKGSEFVVTLPHKK